MRLSQHTLKDAATASCSIINTIANETVVYHILSSAWVDSIGGKSAL
ncbi:MAG: hypothetical protein ACE5K2_05770 [Candidatus Zixiibacteriota bacterium]